MVDDIHGSSSLQNGWLAQLPGWVPSLPPAFFQLVESVEPALEEDKSTLNTTLLLIGPTTEIGAGDNVRPMTQRRHFG